MPPDKERRRPAEAAPETSRKTTVTDEPTRRIPQPFGPDEHKAVARALGVSRAADLLAQTQQSDPFYCGTPADRRDAEWFAQLLEALELAGIRNLHLRRVHYRADALADDIGIRVPGNGRRYGNDKISWQRLCIASKHARRLGLVDAEAFVDRRNPDPVIHRRQRDGVPGDPDAVLVDLDGDPVTWPTLAYLPRISPATIGDMSAGSARLPTVAVAGYDYDPDDQPVLLEIWCEKTTMSDVLAPAARRVGANYVPASGTQSITNAVALVRRAERHDRPAHVLYVSDHDHTGRNMPLSVARDVQFFRDRFDVDVPVTVDTLVLTADQVAAYDLPRDPERGDSTELDALEALHPGELARIVTDAAYEFVDHDLIGRLTDAHDTAVSVATGHWEAAVDELLADRDALLADIDGDVLNGYRQRLQRLADELRGDMAPYRERLDELQQRAADIIDGFDPDLPERPAAVTVEPPERVLYDSRRGWLDQLDAYRAHKANGGAT